MVGSSVEAKSYGGVTIMFHYDYIKHCFTDTMFAKLS